jgi:hypothetical protein
MTRRDDREYREYLREEQRSQRGCIAGRMQSDFYHELLGPSSSGSTSASGGRVDAVILVAVVGPVGEEA